MTRTYLPAGICIYVSQANFTIVLFGSRVSLPPPKNTHTHTPNSSRSPSLIKTFATTRAPIRRRRPTSKQPSGF